jgi:hypothetical protein
MNPDFWHEYWRHGEMGWHQGELNAHPRQE